MKILHIENPDQQTETLKDIIRILDAGGVVVFPTDTLYALVANALNPFAVERVFRIKQRDASKPLPIAARTIEWVRELAHIEKHTEAILQKMYPGKVTIVLPKREIVPNIVTSGTSSIAIRVPDYALFDELLARYGYPLTLTSANVTGEEPTQNIAHIIERFKREKLQPDAVLDFGTLPPSEPSTLLDLTGDKPRILRIGAATPSQLMKLLEI